MAYDPADKADKKIVDKLISDAVTAAIEEATTEHEADKKGLVAKNTELVAKLKKAREGQGDPNAIEKLEAQIETLQGELKTSEKALKTVTKDRDTHKTSAEAETATVRKLLVDGGLTDALVANNVAKQFLPAARALLQGQVTIKADGDTRVAMVGDKSLGDFVKAWSQSDDGKSFVAAPVNGGGDAPGAKPNGQAGKTMTRAQFDGSSHLERANFSREGGKVVETT